MEEIRQIMHIICDDPGCGGSSPERCLMELDGEATPDVFREALESCGWKRVDGGWLCPRCSGIQPDRDRVVSGEPLTGRRLIGMLKALEEHADSAVESLEAQNYEACRESLDEVVKGLVFGRVLVEQLGIEGLD